MKKMNYLLMGLLLLVSSASGQSGGPQTQSAEESRDRNPLDQGNDNCPATIVSSLPYSDYGSTAGRVNNFNCGGNSAPDVIYTVTPTVTDVYRVALCGSAYDTRLEMTWHGACPGTTSIFCNDDACGLQSEVFVQLYEDSTYWVIVDGYLNSSHAGIYQLAIDHLCVGYLPHDVTECAESPDTLLAIDDCDGGPCNVDWGGVATYQTIQCGQTVRGRAFTGLNPAFGDSRDVDWYRFNMSGPGTVIFTMQAGFEMSMQSGIFPPTCDFYPNYTFGPACTPLTLVMDCPAAGDYFVFAAFNGFSGMREPHDYYLRLECFLSCAANSTINAPGGSVGSTCGALNDCTFRPSEDRIVQVNIPTADSWRFSLCLGGTEWDSHLLLSSSCCDSNTIIAESGSGCPSGQRAVIDCVTLSAGMYYVTIEGGTIGACGDYFLEVTRCTPGPCPPVDSLVVRPIPGMPNTVQLSWVNPRSGVARVYKTVNATATFPDTFVPISVLNVGAGRTTTNAISTAADPYARFVVTLDLCAP